MPGGPASIPWQGIDCSGPGIYLVRLAADAQGDPAAARSRAQRAEQDLNHVIDSTSLANEFARTALGYVQEVFRVARRLSGDPEVAADLTQETFLQAWKSFHRYEPGTNCRAWLYRILLNVWSHERRRRTRDPVLFSSDALDLEMASPDPPVPDDLTGTQVLEALNHLPPAQRSIVILADVEDLSYRDIAEILQIPIGTVMSRLSRARRALRQELAGYARKMGIGLRAAGDGERER